MGAEIVAAVSTAIYGTAATGATAAIATAAVNLVISAALSAAASAIAAEVAGKGPSKATRTGNVKQPLTPHEWVYGSVRKGGAVFYVNGSGGANWNLHCCIVFAAHEIESFDEIYLNGERCGLDLIKPSDYGSPLVMEGPFARYPELTDEYAMYVPAHGYKRRALASFQFRKGTTDQAAVPLQVYECRNWDASHQAKGRAYIYERLVYEETGTAWPSFIPALTARLKGKKIYDPRTGLTAWSDNPALIAADVLENLLFIPRERIDLATLIASANICDQPVALKGGGTEKRYRAGGYLIIEGEPEDWLEPIQKAMAGAVVEHHGIYYVHAGAWREPEITITDTDVMGRIRVRTASSDKDRANVVRGMFTGIESYDQPTDFPQIRDQAGIDEDGFEQSMEVDLEWCPSPTQAQRVAKIMLLTQRGGRTVEIGTNLLKALDVRPWDTVNLSVRMLGLSGTYRIIEHKIDISEGALVPTLTLQEISPSIYAWNASTEEQPLQVNASLIPGSDIEPDNLAFSTAVSTAASAFTPAVITATWADPANQSFDAIEMEAILHFQYRIGAGGWNDAVVETKGEVTRGVGTLSLTMTDESVAAASYQFQLHQVERVRIRTRVSDFAWSEWVELNGDLQAPIAGTKTPNFYTSRIAHQPGMVRASWSPPTSGAPANYEVEATMTYEWRQGSSSAWQLNTYTENKTTKAKTLNLLLWDRSKPTGATQFRNHVLNQVRVRAIGSDGTYSSWTII